MAQQTQIATMTPYFNRWMEVYPTIGDLAGANIDDVLKMWEGLGYYRRARNLHKGAIFVMENFDGKLPANKKKLMEIPGIGDYTSSAIASIAFELPEVPIDGNVKRVMARYLNYTENVNARKAHKVFETFLKERLKASGANPNEFSQALMELGALVCTPSNTTCEGCPFKEMCACYRGEVTTQVPFVPKKKPVPSFDKSVLIIKNHDSILMSKDDSDGLMEGLVRLPQIDGHTDNQPITKLRHVFSHLAWDINVYNQNLPINFEFETYWVPIKDLSKLTIITAHRKILQKLDLL
ncbi:A/G-specific adenine glycosylase [Erysipelothrix urinaevulpis]|uniref:A/G-specific adenine glycosylase n=1 Tax=Erysipelothrix urinaevulpis TaxID=2683717 RepID=UPI001F175D2B|nr:NUDIX domain-containing protein [Erysipelothrix urinaevulpis]